MIARIASLMTLIALGILVWMVFNTTGYATIVFSFVGHPLLVGGLLLGFVALSRRLRREATSNHDVSSR